MTYIIEVKMLMPQRHLIDTTFMTYFIELKYLTKHCLKSSFGAKH